jgi:hypothetical protein
VGALSKMRDAPDMYALTPAGRVIVVESTTGVPDDEKVGKLVIRVAQARTALCTPSSRLAPEWVVPVMVTPRTQEEIGGDVLKRAEGRGVVMLCNSEITLAIERVRWAPNADAVLAQWRNAPLSRLFTHGV